jgi:transcriptional regulator of acetoin/glycerol metabolism
MQDSKKLMEISEKQIIYDLLTKNAGNISKTAKEMCVARSTLYRKMLQYNIRTSFKME